MPISEATLLPVDQVEIWIIVDNYVDLRLPSKDHIFQPTPLRQGAVSKSNPLAEHGLCILITVSKGADRHSILFDTGRTKVAAPHNMVYFDIDPQCIEAIVLSHGHGDHTGGLMTVLDMLENPVKVIAHPDGYVYKHDFYLRDDSKIRLPRPFEPADIARSGGDLIENKAPLLVAGDTILVTGEIPRVTAFEQPQVKVEIEKKGRWEPDLILDDQALVVNLQDHGLVVIAGCGHAGIINTVLYSLQLTGKNRLHAVLGGFHLCEPNFDSIIEKTLAEMQKLSPEILVPMHCTGWQATMRFAQEFPSAFIRTSVGTRIVLGEL